MNRRTMPATIALTAATALLLTACGNGDDDKPKANDEIAGVDQHEKKSASPSSTPSDTVGRPKIELPADIKYVFDWSKTGDKDKDAVLHDGEQFIKATDMAVAEQNPRHEAYPFYSEGKMAATTQTYVQAYVDKKIRTTGTYRFYDEVVTLNKNGTASLVYCEDQGKAFAKSIKTGKIDKTPVTDKSYVLYNTALRKNEKGVWVTTEMFMQRGNAKCQL
ncbi:hypothetical protein [Streptomyces sp. ISL-100]|uniref:hypothetical protein n=1 Tax=Streptomyces sp. ISL-100 TaxID=2819173 RepID=UPI001BEC0974|nr:hypothetical protein [Streptomyces sp. ISL-100]MBT2398708.1 hypothetical protein [Streptomyces sp. ISL-100]